MNRFSEVERQALKRERGIRRDRERIGLQCRGYSRYSIPCRNLTNHEPPFCHQHLDQAPNDAVRHKKD